MTPELSAKLDEWECQLKVASWQIVHHALAAAIDIVREQDAEIERLRKEVREHVEAWQTAYGLPRSLERTVKRELD